MALVGIPGLRWNDLSPTATPTLWTLAGESALAGMSVRTALPGACPLDGWLTLNSGARSYAPRPGGSCLPAPAPGADEQIPGWDDLLAANEGYSYDPAFGTLAGDAGPAGRCALGRGAAVALANSSGRVRAAYADTLAGLPPGGCGELLVVDAGALPPAEGRADALRRADDLTRDTLALAGENARVVVAGIADSDPDATHLNALLLRTGLPAWLRAESTRQVGLVQLTDLTPTLLDLLGESRGELVGSVLEERPRAGGPGHAVQALDRQDAAAQAVKTNFVLFFAILIAGQVLAYAALSWRYRGGKLSRARAGRTVRNVGLVFGAAPLATFLVNLLPWAASPSPTATLWAGLVAGSLLVGAAAAYGPWRRFPFGSAGFVATSTVTVLALDVAAGSHLQLTSLYGLSPLVAGRFYGFGNVAFGVFAMSALIAAVWAGVTVKGRSGARAGALAAAAVGAFAVAVDGWPSLGADFGGVLALVPGVAILAFGLSGSRLTALRVVGVVLGTVAVVAAIAVADWTRPEDERSHLGNFVQDVIDGDAGSVLARKAKANLGLFADAPIIVAAAVPLAVLVILALTRPEMVQDGRPRPRPGAGARPPDADARVPRHRADRVRRERLRDHRPGRRPDRRRPADRRAVGRYLGGRERPRASGRQRPITRGLPDARGDPAGRRLAARAAARGEGERDVGVLAQPVDLTAPVGAGDPVVQLALHLPDGQARLQQVDRQGGLDSEAVRERAGRVERPPAQAPLPGQRLGRAKPRRPGDPAARELDDEPAPAAFA